MASSSDPAVPESAANSPFASQRILIAEDVEDTRESLRELFKLSLNLEVDTAADGIQALAMLAERPYSLIITDLRMPKMGGMKLIEEILHRKFPVTIIVSTGHGGVEEAVKAMKLGVYDFLVKPTNPELIIALIQRALRERALRDEVELLRHQVKGRYSFRNVITKNSKMHDVFELIGNIATTSSTVLILGETGTGKEQIARAIHDASSAARSGPFIPIHCAAYPETLLDSELFGHEKGTFTGAVATRKGRFEQANGGTLFLDEVGDIPMSMQVKLLRVLQEREFERLGGAETVRIDVRVIAATNQSLEKKVKEGGFREDLYYRLNVIRIEVPPLRDRPEDIPLLAESFSRKYARPDQPNPQIDPAAMNALLEYSWPGNVRQLENAIERACVTMKDSVVRKENLPPDLFVNKQLPKPQFPMDLARPLAEQLSELTAAFEERYLRRALKRARGHVGKCAKITGLSRRSVTDKISLYKIDKTEFKRL